MAVDYQPIPVSETDGPGRRGHKHRIQQYLSSLLLPISRARLLLMLLAISVLASLSLLTRFIPLSYTPSGEPHPPGSLRGGDDIWAHNEAVSRKLDHCASLGLLRNTSSPSFPLNPILESTYEAAGCGVNSSTVIILSSLYFAEAYKGATFGESIWATSVMAALDHWGYSYMFASMGWWRHDMTKMMEMYGQYPDQVRTVLADPEQVVMAFGEQRERCLRSEENPGGLEEWRFLSFNFWDMNDPNYGPAWTLPDHPLGPNFTLSPAPSSQTTHFSLPYSVEPTCRLHHRQNPSKPRAYLMAKKPSILSPTNPSFPWTLPALTHIAKEANMRIVVGLGEDDDAATRELVKESGIMDLGRLGKEDFLEELARSSVVIGAGRPFISPSPWDALCMGTPVINPILAWDEKDPGNRTSWKMQHGHMRDLNPPYVYSVHAHDHAALEEAVRAALDNPIDSFIPEFMTFEAVANRVGEMIQWDWEGQYRRVEEDGWNGFGDVA